jgi:hypothetical protein
VARQPLIRTTHFVKLIYDFSIDLSQALGLRIATGRLDVQLRLKPTGEDDFTREGKRAEN